MTEIIIGIDISKDHLDAHRLPDKASAQFENTLKGYEALIRWLGPDISRIVFEPTGRYHQHMADALHTAGYALTPVNPLQARRFAEATGVRAKTDKVDARMLAHMGQALHLRAHVPPSKTQKDLKHLQIARKALIKDRTAAKNRAKGLAHPLLVRQNKARLRQIEGDLKAIEAAMLDLIKTDPATEKVFGILCSVPGISAITAAALIVEIPELGTLDARAAASLAGLAPVARDSGKWRGTRFISGGRRHLREALYMPALVATRFNPDMKTKYEQLKAAGKPAKVALTAIMRKLIILANALIRDGRKWSEKRT